MDTVISAEQTAIKTKERYKEHDIPTIVNSKKNSMKNKEFSKRKGRHK